MTVQSTAQLTLGVEVWRGGGIGDSPQREELLRPLPRRLEMVRLATTNVLPTDCEVVENDNIVLLHNNVTLFIQKYSKTQNGATPFCIPRVKIMWELGGLSLLPVFDVLKLCLYIYR